MFGELAAWPAPLEPGSDVGAGSPHECSAMTHSALATIRTSGVDAATLTCTDSALAMPFFTRRPALKALAAFDDFGGKRFGSRRANPARDSEGDVG